MDDNDAIRGQLDSIILRSLLDRDEYGLEIFNNIKLLDNVMGEIKQSTFYNALKRLENARLISSYEGDISKGAKRVYYSITPNGRRYLLDEYRRWDIDSVTESDLFDADDDIDDNTYKKRKRTRRAKLSDANTTVNSASLPNDNAIEKLATNDDNRSSDTDNDIQPRYTSDIKLSTIIGGKYPPKTEPQPKPAEQPDNRTAEEILFSNSDSSDNTGNATTRYTLLGGIDDNKTIEEKKARLNHILSMDFTPTEPKQTVETSETLDVSVAPIDDNATQSINSEQTTKDAALAPEPVFANYSDTIVVETAESLATKPGIVNTQDISFTQNQVNDIPQKEILSKPYVDTYVAPKETVTDNINYIDSLANIYKKSSDEEANVDVVRKNPSVEVTRLNTLNYDDYDEEKFKETSLNKLKQRLALENIKLKQYVKSNTTSFYIGKYYYSNELLRDASIITYVLFLAMCISAHFIAGVTHNANVVLTVVFSLLGVIYPAYACTKWYVMPAKRKRLPLNLSMMFIASLLLYVISVVIIVIIAFFCFKVNVALPSSTITPLVLPLVISAIVPIGVLIYALLFRSGRYNLK